MPGQANNACLVSILFTVSYIAILPDSSVRWLKGFFFFLVDWFFLVVSGIIFCLFWGVFFLLISGLHQRSHNYGLLDKSGLPPIFVNEVFLEHRYIHSSSFVCDCPGTTRVELSD